LFNTVIVHIMTQQRAASSVKRKAESDSDREKSVESKETKKAKVAAPNTVEQAGLAPNGQPTNKALPIKISFLPRAEGAFRIASRNICTLASSQKVR
jgi:AP endonuclease-1